MIRLRCPLAERVLFTIPTLGREAVVGGGRPLDRRMPARVFIPRPSSVHHFSVGVETKSGRLRRLPDPAPRPCFRRAPPDTHRVPSATGPPSTDRIEVLEPKPHRSSLMAVAQTGLCGAGHRWRMVRTFPQRWVLLGGSGPRCGGPDGAPIGFFEHPLTPSPGEVGANDVT